VNVTPKLGGTMARTISLLLMAGSLLVGCGGGPPDEIVRECEALGYARGAEAERCAEQMYDTQKQVETDLRDGGGGDGGGPGGLESQLLTKLQGQGSQILESVACPTDTLQDGDATTCTVTFESGDPVAITVRRFGEELTVDVPSSPDEDEQPERYPERDEATATPTAEPTSTPKTGRGRARDSRPKPTSRPPRDPANSGRCRGVISAEAPFDGSSSELGCEKAQEYLASCRERRDPPGKWACEYEDALGEKALIVRAPSGEAVYGRP
jgi:hypothetical protein